MQTNKRRLLKDLPFANLKKGVVINFINNSYSIHNGDTFYIGGGSSSNGISMFEKSEEDILDTIWNNSEWFEDAVLTHIDFIPRNNSITLKFDSIDIEEAEALTKGIIHILDHLQDGNFTWSGFKNITTSIRNN